MEGVVTAHSWNADELSAQDRTALERILGQSLDGGETIELRVYAHPPTHSLEDAVESIQQHFDGVSAAELEAEIDQACQEVRYGRK